MPSLPEDPVFIIDRPFFFFLFFSQVELLETLGEVDYILVAHLEAARLRDTPSLLSGSPLDRPKFVIHVFSVPLP